jgi:hypothetical protein
MATRLMDPKEPSGRTPSGVRTRTRTKRTTTRTTRMRRRRKTKRRRRRTATVGQGQCTSTSPVGVLPLHALRPSSARCTATEPTLTADC